MKKFFLLIFFLFGCSDFKNNYGKHLSLDEIKNRGYMHVVTEDNYAPFEMIINSKLEGFSNDIIKELKNYASFEIKHDILPWTGLLSSIYIGKYDVAITGSLVSKDRLLEFDFSPPIAITEYYTIIRSDNDNIKSISDLNGKIVGVQSGSVLSNIVSELDNVLKKSNKIIGKIKEYSSYPDAYLDLENGRIDYVINTYITAKYAVKQSRGKFKLGFPIFGNSFYAWPIPKGNDSVLKFFTNFVNYLHNSGKLYSLQEKWFGEKFVNLPKDPIISFEQYSKILNKTRYINESK